MNIVYGRSLDCRQRPRTSMAPAGLPERLVAVRKGLLAGPVPSATWLAACHYLEPTVVTLVL